MITTRPTLRDKFKRSFRGCPHIPFDFACEPSIGVRGRRDTDLAAILAPIDAIDGALGGATSNNAVAITKADHNDQPYRYPGDPAFRRGLPR